MIWKPHVTVAAIIEQDGRFLLVEEETANGLALNQPAGHLEAGETLIEAAIREVKEETAWVFEPEAVIGMQLWRRDPESPSFLRVCFSGSAHSHDPQLALDDGIVATHWLTREQVAAQSHRLRSPLVLICIDDALSGVRYPLSMLQSFLDLA
jgi:ADP-ribose pyrophosphatase YjhB (NUDIX family)